MIKTKIKDLLSIVKSLNARYPKKKFTLDGRLVGDLGEVMAEEIYQIKLYDKIVRGHDGETEYDKKKVQIKTTMNTSIWYPRETHPELLLALEISPNGEPKELYNGDTTPFKAYIKTRTLNVNYNYFTITKGKLIELNKQVDEKSRIKKR